MKGIHCALQGRLGQDVGLRRSESGKDWCRLSVDVGEGDEVTCVSVAVFEEKARALARLVKGAEVYVEGRLSLNAWTGNDEQDAVPFDDPLRFDMTSKYRPDMCAQVIELMSQGETKTEVGAALAALGVHPQTFRRWADPQGKYYQLEFAEAMKRAKTASFAW